VQRERERESVQQNLIPVLLKENILCAHVLLNKSFRNNGCHYTSGSHSEINRCHFYVQEDWKGDLI
jgi:hypothetical protein